MIEDRNKLYARWVSTGNQEDKRKCCTQRRFTRKVRREAKNKWFQLKASKAQKGRHGSLVWRFIREMQHGRRGLIPVRSKAVKDENGITCTSPKAQHQRWRQHFSKVLNLQSQFDESELEKVEQRPMKNEMSCLPSLEDLCEAITRLKNGKAAGSSGILPEMIRVACEREEFLEVLLDLVHEVWKESKVPSDWTNTILIPIPKKGDLSSCDNWRGISLLDIVGKLVASILQRRLQVLAEEVLTESQCGFRRGRGCSDMVFTMRQLVEKSWEHLAKLFVTFIGIQGMQMKGS